ncbi:MAG: DUF1850 domain-containing protein [Alphaproteobacteria bacterium]
MLCLSAGAAVAVLALEAFTLTWVHSAQKSEIQEDWRVEAAGLRVVETRIKGSAAGYDPPPDARLSDGWWHYDPHLPPLPEVTLARSGAVADWRLCAGGLCKPLSEHLRGADTGTPVTMRVCAR